jgi:hypothetical protein
MKCPACARVGLCYPCFSRRFARSRRVARGSYLAAKLLLLAGVAYGVWKWLAW